MIPLTRHQCGAICSPKGGATSKAEHKCRATATVKPKVEPEGAHCKTRERSDVLSGAEKQSNLLSGVGRQSDVLSRTGRWSVVQRKAGWHSNI